MASDGRAGHLRQVEDAWFWFLRLATRKAMYDELRTLAGVDLPSRSYEVLSRLEEFGPLRASELGEIVSSEKSALSRRLAELEVGGLVARTADPTDGRASIVRVTAQGRKVIQRIRDAREEMLAEVLAAWPDHRLGNFSTQLRDASQLLAKRMSGG